MLFALPVLLTLNFGVEPETFLTNKQRDLFSPSCNKRVGLFVKQYKNTSLSADYQLAATGYDGTKPFETWIRFQFPKEYETDVDGYHHVIITEVGSSKVNIIIRILIVVTRMGMVRTRINTVKTEIEVIT